jgi:hypothetical protein
MKFKKFLKPCPLPSRVGRYELRSHAGTHQLIAKHLSVLRTGVVVPNHTSDWKTVPPDVIDAGPGDGSLWPEAVDLTGDGDEWWIEGHVSDDLAYGAWERAVYRRTRPEDYDWIESVDDLCVTRSWWKSTPTSDNDEQWSLCAEDDPAAQPFTVIEL